MVKVVEENEFKSEISEGIVVVDFFATWCGPCKMVAPILDELSTEMEGKVKFIKVDVDGCTEIVNEYEVSNIPAIFIFKNGEKKDVLVGFSPKENIKEKIDIYL
ncbi:thioredoxin [Clostridium saccharoperbutylacetonicum]|uniref:thioredoxin n=1 Tax=Clostridium saccharoperbutylacetonicum TaxID=36745 RepID=UPI000983C0F3|nr:thioredoxin [Clostridium saccharoperbutylacetonicum]AQR93755.1 thioredoxin [Clostridium saccharoperbutylacetonicum]NSB29455.1 thioredoxin 1 [Clostridium saccharoperbutylacetonicum]